MSTNNLVTKKYILELERVLIENTDGENIISDNGILNDEGEPIENPIVLNSILNNNDDRKTIENPIVLNHKKLTEQ